MPRLPRRSDVKPGPRPAQNAPSLLLSPCGRQTKSGVRLDLAAFGADADRPDDREADQATRDSQQRGREVGVAEPLAGDRPDDGAEDDGADHRAEEGADDPLPEAVLGKEDREVPEG